MNTIRTAAGIAALLATAVALSACASAAPGADAADADADATPVVGGELVVGQTDIPPCLDAAITPYNNFAGRAVVDNLFDQDEETGEILPWLATGYEVSDDGLTYTISLRDDVTFSNGEPFTAEAVTATLDNAIEFRATDGRGVAAAYISGYSGSEAVDDHTVTVTFEEPKAGFIQALTEKALGIIWPGSLTLDYDQRCETGPIGTGPFVIEENVPDDHITVVRRDGYAWPSPNSDNPGEAYVDAIRFVEIPEGGVLTENLLSGEVDAAISLSSTDIARVEAEGGQVVSAVSAGIANTIYPNLDHAPFDDEAVRQAFQVGFDRQELQDTIYDQYSPAPTSVISDTVPGHVDLSDALAYDPDGAAALLEDAGWEIADDGIREKDGERLEAEITFTDENSRPLWQLVQAQLLEIGFDLQLRQVTLAESTALQESGEWDLLAGNFTRADPDVLLNTFHPDFVTYARFTDENIPDLVEVLDAQTTELDPAARQELFAEAQRLIVERGYGFPYSQSGRPTVALGNVHGLGNQLTGWQVFDEAWLDAE
ncbi:ABC transporter substrate-binding protein [Microbacterium sp. NPDC055683]